MQQMDVYKVTEKLSNNAIHVMAYGPSHLFTILRSSTKLLTVEEIMLEYSVETVRDVSNESVNKFVKEWTEANPPSKINLKELSQWLF